MTATVGGVTRGQIVEAVEEWLRGRESSGVLADAILALFPPAPSTVGTDGPVAAMLKVYGTPATTRDVGAVTAEQAWDECVRQMQATPYTSVPNPYRAASAKGDGK